MSFRQLLVPLDGSKRAEYALKVAMEIASRCGAKVQMVHVLDVHQESSYEPDMGQTGVHCAETARRYFRAARERAAHEFGSRAEGVLLHGRAADGIIEQAEAIGADLLVMTSRGTGPLAKFWFGSVTDELLNRLSRPILVIRSAGEKHDGPEPGFFQRVLVPLDGTAVSERILEPVLKLGRVMGASLQLLGVVRPGAVAGTDPMYAPPREVPDPQGIDEMRRYLEGVRECLSAGYEGQIDVMTRTGTDVAHEIIDVGNPRRFDLIALTTHAPAGWLRLITSSIADQVIRGSILPVMVIRGEVDAPVETPTAAQS